MKLEFGWDGDGGIGEELIRQTIAGEKWATCGFRRAYTDAELADEFAANGTIIPVVDRTGATRCHVRVTDVFETTFGNPDPRLVAGEGDGDDVAKFQADHRVAWAADFGDSEPGDSEILVVMIYELASSDTSVPLA